MDSFGTTDQLTNMEAVSGTDFSDSFTGGADKVEFWSGLGSDSFTGGTADDYADTGEDSDTLNGGGGNDVLRGGAGADNRNGGANGAAGDTLSYDDSTLGVSINLQTGLAQERHAQGDVFSNMENVRGSAFGDQLTGDGGINTLQGGAGNDLLAGALGAGTLIGGADLDTVDYSAYTIRVSVDLSAGSGAGDTLSEIENIWCSVFGDQLYVDATANTIKGGIGNDFIIAGNGADFLTGEGDLDMVSYQTATTGVFVNLGTGIGANGGVLANIENVTGSAFGDVLYGDATGNTLKGGGGNDFLVGGAGSDTLYGGADAYYFRYEAAGYGEDVIVDLQDGVDKLSFATTLATSFSNFTIAGNGTNAVTLSLAGQAISVQGAAAITLDAGDFLFAWRTVHAPGARTEA